MNAKYKMAKNCYVGKVDGYGYAFVPGSSVGIVLLDIQTKRLLESISGFSEKLDQTRVELLLEKGLITLCDEVIKPLVFNRKAVKSIDTWLHIANCCNLDCSYCYIVNKQPNEFMSLSIAKLYLEKLEQTVLKHGLNFVSIRFAGGEPTLNKEIVNYVINETDRRFVKKGIPVKTTLITNGTILDSEWINLIRSRSIRLNISLDGMGEWHNRSRFFKNGKGSFDVVLKNINFCREQGLNPNILITATEGNLEGLPLLFNYVVNNNLSFRLGIFRDNTGNYNGYMNFTNRLKEVLEECYAFYANSIRNDEKIFHHQFSDVQFNRKPHFRCCGMGHSSATVNHLGQVFMCQARMEKMPVGNINEDRTLLEMVWPQLNFPELQDKTVLDYEGCCDCRWALVCGGGCHVAKKNALGTVTKASLYCDLSKFIIPKIIELKALYLISNLKRGGCHERISDSGSV